MATPIKIKDRIGKIEPSATLMINELSLRLVKEGKKIYRLGFGQSPFPVPEKVVKALRDNAHQKDYLPVKGLYSLREAVANFFNEKYRLSVTAGDILVGPGSKELIYGFQLAYQMDELLLPEPSWVSYEPQAHLSDNTVVWVKTNEKSNWKITPEDIDRHCSTNPSLSRSIILNYPSNPLGITYSENELRALATVFEKYGIIVLADEIYGEVHHEGKHKTIASYYPQGTIISTGLSKWAGAGGWRLGVMVFPKNLRPLLETMSIIASETYTSTSAPIQYAAVEAYKTDDSILKYLDYSRGILKVVGQYVHTELINVGVTMPAPEGGFYLFPNFNNWSDDLKKRGLSSNFDLCNGLLEDTGVALLPGTAFGHDGQNYTARLSYVDFDGRTLLNLVWENPNIKMDKSFVIQNCPKIVEAVNHIKQWLEEL